MDSDIKMKDYIDFLNIATRRTRLAILSIVIASVLLCSALLNSMDSSWMHHRVLQLASNGENGMAYRESRIGPAPSLDATDAEKKEYEERYKAFYASVSRLYVENSVIRLPFFGVTIDGPDAGIVGGLGFCILLAMLLAAVNREFENLKIGFAKAQDSKCLDDFYYLLAMTQLHTVPKTNYSKSVSILRAITQLLITLPCIVLGFVVLVDLATIEVGTRINKTKTLWWLSIELIFLCISVWLRNKCIAKLCEIHALWDSKWSVVKGPSSVVVQS